MTSTPRSDASPTYRGYRLQTLYTLSRILSDNKHFSFRPESKEDLEILDRNHNTVEIIQVKAHTGPLTLSDFSPDKDDSFFRRVAKEFKAQPHILISIVSFGEFGPELQQALNGDERKQELVAKKLAKHNFLSEKEAKQLIAKIQPIVVEEAPVRDRIYAALQENSITGGDHDAAFDSLMFWLYQCAEQKTEISHQDLIERFTNIGKFINLRHAYHQEWFRTIQPMEFRELPESECDELSRGFYQGVSARYAHILADLDVRREQKMQEIAQKFAEKRIVILHAASGQGKSALAYRYLHEYVPQIGRFKIEAIESRKHALDLAAALTSHAQALAIPLVVYCDVSAKDREWAELVKQLSQKQNIFVLVTIREEDFKRANVSGAEMQFSEIELTLEREEAEQIYDALTAKRISAEFLSFEDAWNRFGGEGPLLEFVYLVTQGDTLQARLQQQITQIEDEIDAGTRPSAMLDLLRLVSVASAYEAKVKLKPLLASLNLPAARRSLDLLEKEYALLKISDDEAFIEGLHPIRSLIVADLLTGTPYPSWTEIAANCLPLIRETDLEIFLLYAFSRHQESRESLINSLMPFQPEQWAGVGAIVRALLWAGISDYVQENQALIQEIFETVGDGWYGRLDFDIADALPNSATEFSQSIEKWGTVEAAKNIQALQARQTDKQHIFAHIRSWLAQQRELPASPPKVDEDWLGLAETMFWIGHLQVQSSLTDWLDEANLDGAIETLALETLANFVLGLSYGYHGHFPSWLERNRPKLIERFRRETNTIVLEDDGQKMKVHFVLSIDSEKDPDSEKIFHIQKQERSFHEEALQRIWLLRRLFPDRELYASQGYGHRIWGDEMLIDETDKPGVPRSMLPLFWLRSINSTFRALGNYGFRPENWLEYANVILELRKAVSLALEQLEKGLNSYFRKRNTLQLIGGAIDGKHWDSTKLLLAGSTMLPKCATDEWGLMDELMSEPATQEGEQVQLSLPNENLALQRYKVFLKAFKKYKKYTWQLSLFFEQSLHVMLVNPQLKHSKNLEDEKKKIIAAMTEYGIQDRARLSVMNFADAAIVLSAFQEEFRQLLGHILESAQLDKLERREQQLFNRVWALWYFFALYPNRILKASPQQECLKHVKNTIQEVRKYLRREFKKLSSDTFQIQIASEKVLWEDKPALWIAIDGKNPIEVYALPEQIIAVVRKAVHTIEESALRQAFLPFNWESVVIVPLLRGKSLNAEAWHLKMDLLTIREKEEELSWWNFVPQAIPEDAFTEMGFVLWEDPRLDAGARLSQSVTALSMFVAHIRDLNQIPESDAQGTEQLQAYLDRSSTSVSQILQSALDSMSEMERFYSKFPPEEAPANMAAVMQSLIELRATLLPKNVTEDGMLLKMEDIVEWTEPLEEARNVIFPLYLLWVADVLDEMSQKIESTGHE